MSPEPTLESQRLYQGRVVGLRVDTVALPRGGTARREIVEHRPSVALVALDSQGRAILVRQFRKAVEETLLEVPAGVTLDGEPAEEAARRELEEETGYRAGRLEPLGGVYSSPGFCTEVLHLFLATELIPGPQRAEADEDIQVVPMPLAQAPQMVASGQIRDAKSVAGLLLAYVKLYGAR